MTPPDANRPAAKDQRPRLLDQVDAFRYVTVENAPNYRAILELFVEAKAHYVIELRPPEVLERLGRSGLHALLTDTAELERTEDRVMRDASELERQLPAGARVVPSRSADVLGYAFTWNGRTRPALELLLDLEGELSQARRW